MTVTPSFLVRATAAAAVAAGTLFIAVQIAHPSLDLDSITTTELAVRNTAKILMVALALAGITGMYVSQVRRNGVLGLVGYVILASGYLLIMSSTFGLAYVLPSVADTDPAYVTDVLDTVTSGMPTGEVGALGLLLQVQSACYLVGGLVFGIALHRAGVLARWATALLALGGLASAALAVLPDAFYRLIALPNGIALIALGVSLWQSQRLTDVRTTDDVAGQPETVAVR